MTLNIPNAFKMLLKEQKKIFFFLFYLLFSAIFWVSISLLGTKLILIIAGLKDLNHFLACEKVLPIGENCTQSNFNGKCRIYMSRSQRKFRRLFPWSMKINRSQPRNYFKIIILSDFWSSFLYGDSSEFWSRRIE